MNNQWLLRARNHLRHQRSGRPNRRLFYMHVPKCGGTSVANAIRNSYRTMSPDSERALFHLDPYAAHKAATLSEYDLLSYHRLLLRYCLGSGNYQYVYGHFTFDEVAYEAYKNDFGWITLLRDPVKKWLSLYFFNRYKEGDFFQVEEDLETFLDTPAAVGYGCDYVMQFTGGYVGEAHPHQGYDYQRYVTQDTIDRAIGNLNKFHLVGVLERLAQFSAEFQHQYGAKLFINYKNQSPLSQQNQKKQVSDEMLERIREVCKPNIAIYEHAVEHLLSR